ncbi:nitrogenase component 1 [Ruminococcus albus]|uniref:nitrogenase component 1 n=1 Tax=Ruminococcus albus TaxID=1264 RepID=UPI0022392B57|nr:nitrogenase component 1 [Ruminococcus albus]
MSFIERPRFSCMLGGALATLTSLPRVIPIIHGAQGCGGQLTNSYAYGGYLGVGLLRRCASLPSSNVSEKEIIFGGAERLRKEILAAYDVMDGDLFVVVTSV